MVQEYLRRVTRGTATTGGPGGCGKDARGRGAHRRGPRATLDRRAVPAVGGPSRQPGRGGRVGQQDLPSRGAHDGAAAERRTVRAAGGERTPMAAETRAAPPATGSCSPGEGSPGRRLPLAVVRLPLAPRRDRDRRTHHRSAIVCDLAGRIL